MPKLLKILFFLTTLTFISCKESSKHNSVKQNTVNKKTKIKSVEGLIIYQTENLVIKKLSKHTYKHTSFLKTKSFGKVASNGMLVINQNIAVVFDTPTDNISSLELIDFITIKLKSEILAIIPTHFHEDCVGGLQEFEKHNIPIYITNQTLKLLKKEDPLFSISINEFDKSLTLNNGNKKVYAKYFVEGHTNDHIIGYFPEDNTIFGGCLIKSLGASKGYLGDGNTSKWSDTVSKVKLKYPKAERVIPGHGKSGDIELLDYTIELFESK